MLCHFRSAFSALLLFALACTAPPFEAFCPIPEHGTPAEKLSALCACNHLLFEQFYPQHVRRKFDILFVVNNGPGMAAQQQALASVYAQVATELNSDDADYQIGVVSTDVGSWTAPGAPFGTSAGACDSFAGDDGKLQMVPCQDRPGLSPEAKAACQAVCPDPSFMPSDRPFISRHNGKNSVRKALVPDKFGGLTDRGPEYALGCMLMLGDGGCQVSSPLESARRALDGHLAFNSGFQRIDSHLVIFILTDSDDCSMQLSRRGENDPRTQDCTDPNSETQASCYSLGAYRCLARDVACNEPMNTTGPKTGCHGRTDSPLEPLDTYAEFFSRLKPPSSIDVIGVWPVPNLGDPGLIVVSQGPGLPGSPGLQASPSMASGCRSTTGPAVTGQPQRRLSRFLDLVEHDDYVKYRDWTEFSICDPVSYGRVRDFSWGYIWGGRWPMCLPGFPQRDAQGQPRCDVGYVAENDMNGIPDKLLPLCSASCCAAERRSDEQIVACTPEPEDCYCIAYSPGAVDGCSDTPNLWVWHKDNGDPPPNGGYVNIRCAIECDPAKATR